ncbi:uncharacterized protein BJ171DRAFT_507670, partial [Polychytrium aggregatum]|uniref:uncharacterized protein n=1 Tax=Polychytrium aggregatum TaxID=110093 RepID=UPI0022FEF2EB
MNFSTRRVSALAGLSLTQSLAFHSFASSPPRSALEQYLHIHDALYQGPSIHLSIHPSAHCIKYRIFSVPRASCPANTLPSLPYPHTHPCIFTGSLAARLLCLLCRYRCVLLLFRIIAFSHYFHTIASVCTIVPCIVFSVSTFHSALFEACIIAMYFSVLLSATHRIQTCHHAPPVSHPHARISLRFWLDSICRSMAAFKAQQSSNPPSAASPLTRLASPSLIQPNPTQPNPT